ncbi:hypothetical protein ACHAW6_000352, partial [Cyclotella cf. meneghiniana]
MERSPSKVKKRMEQATAAGTWLSTTPDIFSGTELTKDEWLDNLAIRYGRHPTNLPDQCDGCGAGLTLEHGLAREVGLLASATTIIALTDLHVVIEPTIFYGNGSRASGINTTPTTPRNANPTNTLGDEARGDVLAHSFWNRGRGTVFDVRICDTDSRSYGNTSLSKILECHAKEKKDKYETVCLERCRDFTPLVYSVSGMASKDVRMAKRRIEWILAKKWSHTYSDMASFIRTRMRLAI